MLEAARELAKQAVELSPPVKTQPVTTQPVDVLAEGPLPFLFQSILSRSPSQAELAILRREFEQARKHYQHTPSDAQALLDFGQPELHVTDEPPDVMAEVAACMLVASMIYNLDEAMTHE